MRLEGKRPARVTTLPGFVPGSRERQSLYLRALGTLSNVAIHYGEYRANAKRMPLHPPPPTGNRMVTVLRSDEKSSDVNLASYLLLDGFRHAYEQAIVISNDSGFAIDGVYVKLVAAVAEQGEVVIGSTTARAGRTHDMDDAAALGSRAQDCDQPCDAACTIFPFHRVLLSFVEAGRARVFAPAG